MEKTTVLARLRLTLAFNRAARDWFRQFTNLWFVQEDGGVFLSEFGGTWEGIFVEVADNEIRDYFSRLGVPGNLLPFVKVGERYRGSWIAEAAVLMAATVGTAYGVLKGISELPDIADGLGKLKKRIVDRLRPRIDAAVRERLTDALRHQRADLLPSPPPSLIDSDLVIDGRPLLSLSPAVLKTHRVHLSAGVSRDSFTLENLGDDPLRDVRLGLFRTRTERHQWAYADAYAGQVALLSAHQTVVKRLGEFRDRQGNVLDLSDGQAAHVDCWIEDSHGIYLFRFYLEAG